MFSTSGEKGFTLVESLIAIVILAIAAFIAFLPSKVVLNALEFIKSYFSPEHPVDSALHAYQVIMSLEETLMKKGYGTAIPDISDVFNCEDVQVEVDPQVEVVSYAGNDMLEVITITATYTTPSGEKKTIVKKVVRGRF